MISREEAEERIESAKTKVTFAISDAGDKSRVFAPHFAYKKKPNYHRIEKKIKGCLLEGKFQEVASCFDSTQEMEEFYRKNEGRRLFRWALTTIESEAPLKYLIANIPPAIVHDAFADDNFSSLKGYLGSGGGMEKYGYATEGSRASMSKKLEALLQLGDGDISALINNRVNEKVRQLFTLSPQ